MYWRMGVRKIGLVVLALCLPPLVVQAVFAGPRVHITPDTRKAFIGIPVCRDSFHPNISQTNAGQPYICESANITCAFGYRMDSAGTTAPFVDEYMCVPKLSKLAGSPGCSLTFHLQRISNSTTYVCYRDNAVGGMTACSQGWKPTYEDYTHGLLFGGPSTTEPRDLQPTTMFYSCAPA